MTGVKRPPSEQEAERTEPVSGQNPDNKKKMCGKAGGGAATGASSGGGPPSTPAGRGRGLQAAQRPTTEQWTDWASRSDTSS